MFGDGGRWYGGYGRYGWEVEVKVRESKYRGLCGSGTFRGRFGGGGSKLFKDGLECGRQRLRAGWEFCNGCEGFQNGGRRYGAGLGGWVECKGILLWTFERDAGVDKRLQWW